jgi:hypothetical protein
MTEAKALKPETPRGIEDEDDAEAAPPRRRWLRLRWVIPVVLLLLLIGGELAVSRLIANKLRKTVDDKLDAHLEIGALVYVPPYGAWVWDARIVRDGRDLFTVSRVKLSLAELPLDKDKPIVIARLTADQPILNYSPRAFDHIRKPPAEAVEAKKFSGMLRLEKVRLFDGQVTYTDPQRPGAPPTSWQNLNLDMDTIRQSVSKFTFHLVSRAVPAADATAAGTIDVDDLVLEVQSSSMKVRAEPDPPRTTLPAAVQEFIRRQRISGTLSVTASGQVPLKDPKQGAFLATVELQDGTAALPPRGEMLDHARAMLGVRQSPGGPVVVELRGLDFAGANKQLRVNGGTLELNTTAGMWSVADVVGQVVFTQPTTSFAIIVPPTAPPQQAPEPKRGIEKLEIAGKGDFTMNGSGPFDLEGKDPWQAIRHEVILHPRDVSLRPKNFAHKITGINGGEVRLEDGMIVMQDLSGHYGGDLLNLRAGRVPVDGLPKVTRWQDLSGTINFHRPVQPYSPKLDKIFDALDPNGTFTIAGSYTLDKRFTDPGINTFDLIVSSNGAGSFAVGKRKIALDKLKGEATVTQRGVDVRELEAAVLDGKVQATGSWQREEATGPKWKYDAEAVVRDLDLAKLETQLRDEPADKPLVGHVYAHATLSGATTKGADKRENLAALRASGEAEIVRGKLFKVPVLKDVAKEMKGMESAATVSDAAVTFDIEKGRVTLRDAAISSSVVGLQGGGTIDFSGDLDLRVVAAPLADWRENLKGTNIPVVSDVVGGVAGVIQKMLNKATGTLLYEFRVGGTLEKTQVVAVPAPVLTDTAAFVFGRMLEPPTKERRPLDLIRRDAATTQPRAATR